jgi:apolipoprotein N-acyltransferase
MERLAGRIILLWGWPRNLVALLAGGLLVLTQAPYDFFAAGFVSLPLLVWLLDGATGTSPSGAPGRLRSAFVVGWMFGFGYFLAGLWWIGGAVLVEGDTYGWALPFAVAGIPAILAVFYGGAAVIARLFWARGIWRIAGLAFGIGVAEWLRSFVFTGFPWNAIGYGAMPMPLLMQSAAAIGIDGMNVLTALVFALPALVAERRHRLAGFVIALVLVGTHFAFGVHRLSVPQGETTRLAVRVVQPSVGLSIKWDKDAEDRIFKDLLDLSSGPVEGGADATALPDMIVWPETSLPFLISDRPDALSAIADMLQDDQTLLAGSVREEAGVQGRALYYNSVIAVNDTGEIVGAVDKVHLVPFGEYLPFADLLARIGLEQIVAGPMNFAAGALRPPLDIGRGLKAAVFICYEIIFPDLVAVDVTSASLIVNVTNDAWFGDTPGPYQHLRQAQVRAVETGLPVVRAANTGISAVIDERGRIIDALAMDERGRIDASVPVHAPHAERWRSDHVGLGLLVVIGVLAAAGAVGQRSKAN